MLPITPISSQPIGPTAPQLDNRPLVATILRVEGDQAVLALAGIQVVARLSSPDQAAWLAGQRTALFVPHWLNSQTLALQWVGSPDGQSLAAQSAVQVAPDMLGQVLRQLGAKADAPEQLLAAALLANHLPLTSENLDTLAASLAHLAAWGAPEAAAAARLLAQGLTPTPGLVDQALAQGPALSDSLGQLQQQMSAFMAQHGGDPATDLLTPLQNALAQLAVDGSAQPGQIAAQVRTIITQMGRSVENALAQQGGALPNTPGAPPSLLLRLAELRPELLAHFGAEATPLANAIDQLLAAARREQLGNAHAETTTTNSLLNAAANAPNHGAPATANPAPAAERWLGLSLPLANTNGDPAWANANLRVAYQPPDNAPERINLSHTRLVLRLEVDGQPVAVDLSIAGTHVGARVILPTDELRDRAEQELPSLGTGLAKLGFTLQAAHCTTGDPPPLADGPTPATLSRYA
jgi:hypothetical protein